MLLWILGQPHLSPESLASRHRAQQSLLWIMAELFFCVQMCVCIEWEKDFLSFSVKTRSPYLKNKIKQNKKTMKNRTQHKWLWKQNPYCGFCLSLVLKDLCVINLKKETKRLTWIFIFAVSEGSSDSTLFFMGRDLFQMSSLSGIFWIYLKPWNLWGSE